MQPVMLGGPRARRRREELVLGGRCVVQSPHGLAPLTRTLVEALPAKPVERVLTGLDTEGAGALLVRRVWPDAAVTWFHLDAYVGRKVQSVLEHNAERRVEVVVAADVPDGPFDLVALEFPKGFDQLLALDVLEAVHAALAPGGRLVAATDAKPEGLRKILTNVFGKCVPAPAGSKTSRRAGRTHAFYAVRHRDAPRVADRSHVLTPTFTVAGATVDLQVETRPGTFSHGRVDRGTRALIEWLEPRDARSIVDLGAGCGTIGLALAAAVPEASVVLVDSNVRAVECARRNVVRNGLEARVEALVRPDLGDLPDPGRHDLAVANPPYFGNFRIARSFVEAAHRALAPGGRFALVAKAGPQHAEHVREVFGNASIARAGDYAIVSGYAQG